MRSAVILSATLAVLAATACNSIHSAQSSQRAPAPQRWPSTAATLGIPPGQLPPLGLCRVWLPGVPSGHQPRARACASIEVAAPAGSWIVYRPPEHKKEVYVRMVDRLRPGMVVGFRVYDIQRGTLIREG
jgi:hypothetical protein